MKSFKKALGRLTQCLFYYLNFMKRLLLIVIIVWSLPLSGQVITGTVYDAVSQAAIEGVTIYLDGTNIGTISNLEGVFNLDTSEAPNASIVVRHLGYSTQVFSVSKFASPLDIYLEENPNVLNEVVVEADPWSRAKKMRIFKSEFLGKTNASKYCRILNEDDIRLQYIPSTQTLVAYTDNPIIIKNSYLGYTVEYSMHDFEVEFTSGTSGLQFPYKVYHAGTSYFKELHRRTKKKQLLNRNSTYKGSLIHFMSALKNRTLTENNFTIYYERFPVPPYRYFQISATEDNGAEIIMRVDKVSILYDQTYQSTLSYHNGNNKIFIDINGNHSPPDGLLVGGDFGLKRISNMLPLNYKPEVKQ